MEKDYRKSDPQGKGKYGLQTKMMIIMMMTIILALPIKEPAASLSHDFMNHCVSAWNSLPSSAINSKYDASFKKQS